MGVKCLEGRNVNCQLLMQQLLFDVTTAFELEDDSSLEMEAFVFLIDDNSALTLMMLMAKSCCTLHAKRQPTLHDKKLTKGVRLDEAHLVPADAHLGQHCSGCLLWQLDPLQTLRPSASALLNHSLADEPGNCLRQV
jgi:hypothetical protein